MVNVFIIHSGKDEDLVNETVIPYLCGNIDDNNKPAHIDSYANVLMLKSGKSSIWKPDAHKKIKQAQVVIVLLGDDSNKESKIKTMGWEVDQALKYNKQIMIYNPKSLDLPRFLYHNDPYSGKTEPIAGQFPLKLIKKKIDDFGKGYYDIFSPVYEKMDDESKKAHKDELLEQYKMFQKTSEDLVSRRQAVNSFYISVNSALVALIGVVMGWVDAPAKNYIVAFMCLTGVILSLSWANLLESYGNLNSAKMKVLNLIEEQLPIALYDVEWKVMSDKLNNKKYVSFTKSEKRIPLIFAIVYVIITLALIALNIAKML